MVFLHIATTPTAMKKLIEGWLMFAGVSHTEEITAADCISAQNTFFQTAR